MHRAYYRRLPLCSLLLYKIHTFRFSSLRLRSFVVQKGCITAVCSNPENLREKSSGLKGGCHNARRTLLAPNELSKSTQYFFLLLRASRPVTKSFISVLKNTFFPFVKKYRNPCHKLRKLL